MPEQMNLYQKLHAIMQEMDNIPKTGKHPKQGWAFHQANDIFNGARAAFIKHRVIIVPGCIPEHTTQIVERTTKSGQRGDYEQVNTRTNIVFTYTFIDIDSGEKLETAWPGESVDYDDKGTQQAGTSSMKYMLMKMFLATPDHDPDYNSIDTTTGEITAPPASNGHKPEPIPQASGSIVATHVKYIKHKTGKGAGLIYEADGIEVMDFTRDMLRQLGDEWQLTVDQWEPQNKSTAKPIKLLHPVKVTYQNVFDEKGDLAYRKAIKLENPETEPMQEAG